MSLPTNTITRRNFLKGAAYASALSVSGLSTVALANSGDASLHIESGTITLLNQSTKTVALDVSQPISLEKKNGWVVINVNKASNTGSTEVLNLDAGQKLSFAIETGSTPSLVSSNHQHGGINSTVFVGDDDLPASLYHATYV